MFAGGVESAAELVRRREADPREFMLLAGYSGWGPWQLQRVSGGRWVDGASAHAALCGMPAAPSRVARLYCPSCPVQCADPFPQELRAGTWLPVAASQAVIMDVLKGACSAGLLLLLGH